MDNLKFSPGDQVAHRNGGIYTIVTVCFLESTLVPHYVYHDGLGTAWARPVSEMEDGRFTLISFPAGTEFA